MNILMWLEDWDGRVPLPAVLKPRPLWTGKQVISTILPAVNCRRTASWYRDGEPVDMSPTDAQVLIQGGELVTGTLCKRTLGASAGSLVHVIWNDAGPEAARAFLSQAQYLTNHWLLQRGFSIGIGDTVADAGTMRVISETIERAEGEVKRLTQKLQARELEAQPGRSMMESFENQASEGGGGGERRARPLAAATLPPPPAPHAHMPPSPPSHRRSTKCSTRRATTRAGSPKTR